MHSIHHKIHKETKNERNIEEDALSKKIIEMHTVYHRAHRNKEDSMKFCIYCNDRLYRQLVKEIKSINLTEEK